MLSVVRLNISVPDELAAEVRERGLPVSRICQAALRRAVAEDEDPDPVALLLDLSERARTLAETLTAAKGDR